MYGHEALIEYRTEGRAPATVWIDTDPPGDLDLAADWWQWRETCTRAHVQLEPKDNPARLDLRFVVGLQCHIDGTNLARVRAMRDACIAAGAKRVLATTLEQLGSDEWITYRMVESTDTAGEFIFPMEVVHG